MPFGSIFLRRGARRATPNNPRSRAYRKKYGLTYPIAMDPSRGFALNMEHGSHSTDNDLTFPAHVFISPFGYLNCYRLGEMGERMMRVKIREIVSQMNAVPGPGPQSTRSPPPTPSPTPLPAA